MPAKPYKTKMVVEVEVEHWGDLTESVITVQSGLLLPAIKSVKFLSAKSNHCSRNEPLQYMRNIPVKENGAMPVSGSVLD